jgi:hypothetical protein
MKPQLEVRLLEALVWNPPICALCLAMIVGTIRAILRHLSEIREFVKDLWFRNEQAKIAGELENYRLRREIDSKYHPTD